MFSLIEWEFILNLKEMILKSFKNSDDEVNGKLMVAVLKGNDDASHLISRMLRENLSRLNCFNSYQNSLVDPNPTKTKKPV